MDEIRPAVFLELLEFDLLIHMTKWVSLCEIFEAYFYSLHFMEGTMANPLLCVCFLSPDSWKTFDFVKSVYHLYLKIHLYDQIVGIDPDLF